MLYTPFYIKTSKIGKYSKIALIKEEFTWTLCPCHVTYAFQSESTLHSCLNLKELLARSRREI